MPAMSQIAPIIADLVAETTRDHELGTAVHTMLRTPRHLQIQELFTHAAARGNSIRNHARTERGTSGLNRHWREIVRAQPVTTPDAATAGSADTHAAWHKQRQQARHPCTNIAATSAMNHSGLPPLPSPLLSDRGRRQRSTPTAPEVGQLAALVRMARYFPDRASDSHRPSIRLLHSVFRVHQMLQRR